MQERDLGFLPIFLGGLTCITKLLIDLNPSAQGGSRSPLPPVTLRLGVTSLKGPPGSSFTMYLMSNPIVD